MKIRETVRKALSLLAALLLAAGTAAADGAAVEERGLDLSGSSLRYPVVAGLGDENLEKQVNGQIQADLNVSGYLARMSQLISDENRNLHAEWRGGMAGDVFSAAMSARGALDGSLTTHVWTWSNIDLRDGHEISLAELFSDETEGLEALGAYLEEKVAPELSDHLMNRDVLPLPEGFLLEPSGLTLLYPAGQLSTLSDRAGDIRLGWNEIREVLNLEEGSLAERIGVPDMITLTETSAEQIRHMTESGQLPGIPVTIGESLKALTDRYHLLTDPDIYEQGRMFSLEGGCFRNVALLTDYISERWDESIVQGIRMDEGCAWGLCVGETDRTAWREMLGEPDSTAEFDEDRAEAYRTEPGSCDYYRYGAYMLQLYCDGDGILKHITLAQ